MLNKNFDGWGEDSELDETSLTKQLDGWSSFPRDRKIGIFMSLLRHNKYTKESEFSLLKLKTLLERENEHHLRYLSHINSVFNKKEVINLDSENDYSKEFLIGKIFQPNVKGEEIKILSIPKEIKYISKYALLSDDSDPIIYNNTSNHFVENPDYESDSDDPTSGAKTPRSLPSPGPITAPKRLNTRVETGNIARNNTDSRETRPNNKPFKPAERYVKPAPKVQQITLAESIKALNDQKERELKIIERQKASKAQERQRELDIAKLSKQRDKAIKKNGKLVTKVTPKQPVVKSNVHTRKNSTNDETIKLYTYSEILLDSPLEDGTIVISSSKTNSSDQDSSDREFEKILNDDKPSEHPKAKKPKTSQSNKDPVFHSGYPENGEEKATTTFQILGSSLIVNPTDLKLIMGCLKGSYNKPSHLTKDYYMIIIDEQEKIIDKKITYWITGFEIYFDEIEGPRWDLVSYNQLDI